MIVAVADTNVLVSGLVGMAAPGSPPGEFMRRWRSEEFLLVLSSHSMIEIERTLTRPYFQTKTTHSERQAFLSLLQNDALFVPIGEFVHGVASHPEDDLILATALSAKADYLITGDTQLQKLGSYDGVTILSPRAFLDRLESEPSD